MIKLKILIKRLHSLYTRAKLYFHFCMYTYVNKTIGTQLIDWKRIHTFTVVHSYEAILKGRHANLSGFKKSTESRCENTRQ